MVEVKCPSFTPTSTIDVISLFLREIVNLRHFDASIKFLVGECFVKKKILGMRVYEDFVP